MSHRLLKLITLGCKVNQYESEYLCQGLARLGYRKAGEGEAAELCIVNTCTVTAEAEAKSRKAIRHLNRLYPAAEIIVIGCYATRAAEEVAALPGVVEVLTDKRHLPDLLARRGLIEAPRGIASFGERQRAYVKVQDGCRMGCTYCIIPVVRPVLVSRPVDDVLAEIVGLVAHGHREIVLTGIHLGHYGVDFAGAEIDLARLLRRIVELPGEFRVRISSIEAAEVTTELLAVMADRGDRICPHLHISLQSGSDGVLARMGRRWPVRRFLERCEAARRALQSPALTTDVIVGFPGESADDFTATCRAVSEAGFSKLHVFRFSPRQGTPAATFPDRVPPAVQRQRAAELAALGRRLRRAYFQSLLGHRLQVLVETPWENGVGRLVGTSCRYVPVIVRGDKGLVGRLLEVTAGCVMHGGVVAAGDEAGEKSSRSRLASYVDIPFLDGNPL